MNLYEIGASIKTNNAHVIDAGFALHFMEHPVLTLVVDAESRREAVIEAARALHLTAVENGRDKNARVDPVTIPDTIVSVEDPVMGLPGYIVIIDPKYPAEMEDYIRRNSRIAA